MLNVREAHAVNTLINELRPYARLLPREVADTLTVLAEGAYKRLNAGHSPDTMRDWYKPTGIDDLVDRDDDVLGHGDGDTTPITVLVESFTRLAARVETTSYEQAAALGEREELFAGIIPDLVETEYTVLDS